MTRIALLFSIIFMMVFSACEKDPTPEERRAEELAILEAFIAENYPNATKTESGLYILWNTTGAGDEIDAGDYVSVQYVGKFLEGGIFDASDYHDGIFEFTVGAGQVIPAWDEALALCRVGDKITIVAPSTLAYGNTGSGTIPGYTSLVFDINVIEVFY